MSWGSRVRLRRQTKTVTVKSRTHSGSTYTENNQELLLIATWEPRQVQDTNSETTGTFYTVTDVFFFEKDNDCGFPTIGNGDVIIDNDTSQRYEVMNVSNEGGGNHRLMVSTKRLEWLF